MSPQRRALFSFGPVLLLLLTGEVGARLAGAPVCEPIVPSATGWDTMLGDPRYLWKLEPNRRMDSPDGAVTQINAVGLRTRLLPTEPKKPGEKRILVTGDSSVYGWGQPDGLTYAEQLEAELNANFTGVTFSVINLGVPGYSTVQTLRLLEDLGWAYEPDLLVVHNIFSDCNIDSFQDEVALRLTDPDGTAFRWALHRSRLYCSVYMPWARAQGSANQATNRVLQPGNPVGANAGATLEVIDQVIDLSRVPLSDYLDNLSTIKAEAAARGATMVVAPLAQEWDVGIWNAPMTPPTEGQVLPWYPYREAQAEWAAEAGVPRIYLPEVFAKAPVDKTDLFIDNMHPSVTGASIMAHEVVQLLRAQPALLDLEASAVAAAPPWRPKESTHRRRGGGHGGGRQGGPPPGQGQGPAHGATPPQGPPLQPAGGPR